MSYFKRINYQYKALRLLFQKGLIVAFFALPLHAIAVPANSRPFTYTQPDGVKVVLSLVGDEHYHVYLDQEGRAVEISEDGYVRVINENGQRLLTIKRMETVDKYDKTVLHTVCKEAATGDVHGLIVLVNFSDKKFTNTQENIADQMNVANYSLNGATGSARDYFIAQSMGQFKPTFDVVGPVELELPYRYYGGNLSNGSDRHPDVMIFSAVQKAVEQGLVDLNDYDRDGDGIVDMVYIIYAGLGEADGGDANTIWPHMSNLQGSAQFAYQQIEGKKLGLYACSAEYRGDMTFSGIGTFCHEYGHCLGLPDIYDVTYSGGYGMGSYDIMSSGSYLNNGNTPPNYSGFERYSVGWLTYEDVTKSSDFSLSSIDESNRAIRLSSPTNPNEYFVLENRQKTGWDAYLPARGLMISHIDYDEDIWNKNAVNIDKNHQRVMMMAADNTWNTSTQSGDLYPGLLNNTEFTDTSIPNATLWDGTSMGKSVTDISLDGNNVSFHVEIDASGIVLPEVITLENKWYNLSGQPVDKSYKGLKLSKGKKSFHSEFTVK